MDSQIQKPQPQQSEELVIESPVDFASESIDCCDVDGCDTGD